MAFKKTSEGRVFFQGSGNGTSANDPRAPVKSAPQGVPAAAQGGPTQLQIVALLRSLNEKLKTTQVERNAMRAELDNYRRAMDGLQGKAGRAERAEQLAQETMKELEETRKLILDIEERQAAVEKENKSNSEKIRIGAGSYRDLAKRLQSSEQKQEEIGRKVEEAAAQQGRIMRQIEKAIEDRTRFMRKIERIEETVIQTRDALNAKAMVLLTDQAIAGAVPADIDEALKMPQEPGVPTAIPDEELVPDPWGNRRSLQAAAIVLLIVAGILAGWAVTEIRRSPSFVESAEFQINEQMPPPAAEPETAAGADAILDKWQVHDDTSAFAGKEETVPAPATRDPDPADDIGIDLTDQEKVQKMLEENPDALAAELNKIEPSSPVETAMAEPEKVSKPETAPAETTQASLPAGETISPTE